MYISLFIYLEMMTWITRVDDCLLGMRSCSILRIIIALTPIHFTVILVNSSGDIQLFKSEEDLTLYEQVWFTEPDSASQKPQRADGPCYSGPKI